MKPWSQDCLIAAEAYPGLVWDNIDRLEETLSGKGTSHSVSGIAVQARHFGPQLPREPSTNIVKIKKRSVEAVDTKIFSFTM